MPELRTPRELSPCLLVQEFLRDEPWKLLIACIFLNQTTSKQACRILPIFLERWPTPESLWASEEITHTLEEDVKELIRPLGLMNRRFKQIWKMSLDYMALDIKNHPERVGECFGVGKYAKDSFDIFFRAYLVQDVTDKELKKYVAWAVQRAQDGHGDLPGT